jgi:hypothetical protein
VERRPLAGFAQSSQKIIMRCFPLSTLVLLSLAPVGVTTASAAVLARYAFPGPVPALMVTTVDANVTAGDVSFAGGVTTQFTSLPDMLVVNVATPNAIAPATAVSTGSFFEITLAPTPGNALNLASFTFDAAAATVGAGYVLRSSLDGYTTNLAAAPLSTLYPTFAAYNVSLAAASFQGVSEPVSFRVYTFTPATNPAAAYDNVTINGVTIPVPEPTAGATLLLAGGFLARRRRAHPQKQ